MAAVLSSSSSTLLFLRPQRLTTTCCSPSPPLRRFSHRYRLHNFHYRCSITNTEVLTHVDIHEEIREQFPESSTDCFIPPIHIDSEILENESLNLLAENTDIDTLLTTLPVLSEEEQNVIAATPAHPAGLFALYASCLAGNLVEQLWNFAWPVALALLHPSLLPVAVMSFFTKLAVIVGGPLVGRLMDHFPRVPAYNCLSFIQAAAQLLSAGMIIHAHRNFTSSARSALPRPWFTALVLAGAVERLSGLVLGVAVERDWVVLLAGTNRPIALAEANAVLSRIDLLCEIAGASLFGFLLSKYEPVFCLQLAASLMIASLPVVLSPSLVSEWGEKCRYTKAVLMWFANMLSAGVLDRPKCLQLCCKSSTERPFFDAQNIVEKGIDTIKHGWVEYMQQPVLPASIAYVLLYFNVVLSPGGLMTAFLTQRGLNTSIIGGFSALCACMGVAATLISAHMVKRFGILKAGAAGLVFQAALLTVAVVVYWSGYITHQTPLLFFLLLIVLSRLGNMSYDVIGAQILQTGIPASNANLIGTTEVSFASLAESVMLGVAILANDVSHFGFLAMLSLSSVIGAAWLFCRWLSNPTDAQRSLFSFDPHS